MFLVLLVNASFSQFAPPAGQPGTTAIYKDSSVFVAWATSCTVARGFVNISDTTITYNGANHATYGVPENAVGKADDSTVVSLGDGGKATLAFNGYIKNGPGYDFAVFENGLTNTFLELGFVEVSSDGSNFVRFPCTSLSSTSTQIPSFGTVDATKLDNLAGKYRSGFGTPFDLDTLKNIPGLDINKITRVRIVDVVGSIQPAYATYDTEGHAVNDLWPTPFNTCGFDLDGVGVIHFEPSGIPENLSDFIRISPNPATEKVHIENSFSRGFDLVILNNDGQQVKNFSSLVSGASIDLSDLPGGLYLFSFHFSDGSHSIKKIIKW